ncbi:unnamed protein product [Camellia sinensis]
MLQVGTIGLLALTRLVVFMLFFLAATVNAIIIYLLVSLAAAGGFLALFFACVTTIYIGALSVAVFVISTATISAIIAVLIATSWIGFFWTMWLATKKSVGLAKHSLTVTGSTLSAYSSAQHVRSRHESVFLYLASPVVLGTANIAKTCSRKKNLWNTTQMLWQLEESQE